MNLSKYHLPVTLFLILNLLITLVLSVWYYFEFGFVWSIFIFALVFAALTNLSITVGYHRLFAHRSYETNSFVRFLLLLFATSAWQGSALKWASDHRIHHQKIDTDLDPYNIHRGFWHAHMGWLFLHETVNLPVNAPDLQQDAMLRFQDRYYIALAIFTAYFLPAITCWLAFGDFFGGLIIAGGLRIVLTQQSTFFINSLCHYIGSRPYDTNISARDSWIMAILTHGEGYHNFHHAFQSDYRNGIKWYHWDPTKWTIFLLACIGAAKNLKTIPMEAILRARLQVDEAIIAKKGRFTNALKQLKVNILTAQKQLARLTGEYRRIKSEYQVKKSHVERDFQDRKQALGEAYQFKKEELQAEYRRIIDDITERKEQRILQIQRDIKITKIELSGMLAQWKAHRSFA
jgi:stearoyl-CoA desaturase (delta-9 desaturase)